MRHSPTARRAGGGPQAESTIATRSSVVLSGARHAFTDGMNVVSWVGAGVLIAAAAVTAVLLSDID